MKYGVVSLQLPVKYSQLPASLIGPHMGYAVVPLVGGHHWGMAILVVLEGWPLVRGLS